MIQVIKQQQKRNNVAGWIYRHVNVNKETVKSLLQNFIKGSTYSSGEVKGIFEDFGQAIAASLSQNGKVVIDGFGTFSVTVGGAGWKENKDELRKDNIKPSIRFVPADEFLAPVLAAEIVVKTDGVVDEDSNTDEPSTTPTTPSGGNEPIEMP